ncbi:hypothetical protein A9K55_003976 [Cordyceps militaris]|uniref:Uncharacterized protein n=1 Tax=Cordyceps militaris TaxID=73501 RepID=A0A2H4SMT6_CORMI|nr:hypothetical protein A9K55_003976 [Cordyceps militaris]
MDMNIEDCIRTAFSVITVLMRPFARLESFCLHLLDIDASTTFRMLPVQDAHVEFPAILPNGLAFIWILLIPNLVCRRVRWLLMLPRVWLFTAFFNFTMVSILQDPDQIPFLVVKLVFSSWIL